MNSPSQSRSPLVSIFLPTHARCRGGMLQRSIESVLKQTYDHFELFVCDDASTDGSQELIAEYVGRDSRIRHLRFEPQVGFRP